MQTAPLSAQQLIGSALTRLEGDEDGIIDGEVVALPVATG